MDIHHMDIYQFLLVALPCTFLFALVGGLLWVILQRKNTLARNRLVRAEALGRLVDKFATGTEAADFLKTPEGETLLKDPSPPAEQPRFRVLRFVQAGAVFIFLGLGFFLNAYWLRHESDLNYVRQMMELQIWGTFSIALGGGLVFAAFLTRRLVKRWGLNGEKATVEAQHFP